MFHCLSDFVYGLGSLKIDALLSALGLYFL